VVGCCTGKEVVEMLVEILHGGHLDVDVLAHLEVMVGNTGLVAVKIDSYMEVVNTGM
jgi:hypothetical protein